jgi:hypothetical protein
MLDCPAQDPMLIGRQFNQDFPFTARFLATASVVFATGATGSVSGTIPMSGTINNLLKRFT